MSEDDGCIYDTVTCDHMCVGCKYGRDQEKRFCCFCGIEFEPWIDSDGDINDVSCWQCDMNYEIGIAVDSCLGDNN